MLLESDLQILKNKIQIPSRYNETYVSFSNLRPLERDSTMRGEVRNRAAPPELPWPVEMLSPHGLRPADRNARTHSKKQIRQIADSIQRFGVINPIVADDRGRIICGHARAEAAKLIGLKPELSGIKTEDEGLYTMQHKYWLDVMKKGYLAEQANGGS